MFVYRLFLFFFSWVTANELIFWGGGLEHFVSWLCNLQQQQPSVFFFLRCISFHSHHSRGAFKEKSCPRTLSSTLTRPFHQNWSGRLWWERVTWQKPYEVQTTSKTCLIRKSLKKNIYPTEIAWRPHPLRITVGLECLIFPWYLFVSYNFKEIKWK